MLFHVIIIDIESRDSARIWNSIKTEPIDASRQIFKEYT